MTDQLSLLDDPPPPNHSTANPPPPDLWDEWAAEDPQSQPLSFEPARDFAEIDAAINDRITGLDEQADLHSGWQGISLGGPVEPYFPEDPWNGLLLVGKAPGDAEIAHGVPFTGRSGRLLDRMLAKANIERRATLITNTFRMQAPWSVNADGRKIPDDISHFFTDDPRLGNASLPSMNGRWVLVGPDDHIRDLWRLVRDRKPKVIVAMGAIAAWALTHDSTLRDRLGTPLANPCSAAPVLITYHPAYALHKQDEAIANLIATHIQLAANLLTTP